MSTAAHGPDLGRIAEGAVAEVLGVLLSRPVTVRHSSDRSPLAGVADQITSTVLLAGQRLSGRVDLHLPRSFVTHVVRLLTGLDGAARDADATLDDAAGELANLVAGRVAARLAADGCPCTLGTPSVSRNAGWPTETGPVTDHGRADLFCEGHSLTLELRCRYAVP